MQYNDILLKKNTFIFTLSFINPASLYLFCWLAVWDHVNVSAGYYFSSLFGSTARSILTRLKVWWRYCSISCLQRTRVPTRHSSRMVGPKISSLWSLWTTVSHFAPSKLCHGAWNERACTIFSLVFSDFCQTLALAQAKRRDHQRKFGEKSFSLTNKYWKLVYIMQT